MGGTASPSHQRPGDHSWIRHAADPIINISAFSPVWADFFDVHIWSAIRSESYNAAESAAAGRIEVDSGS